MPDATYPLNEFFSTLRSIHLLLMAVSLVLSSFVLSPRDSEIYYTARIEAESLIKVKFSRFETEALYATLRLGENYVAELRKKQADEMAALSIEISRSAMAPVLIQVILPLHGQSMVKIKEFIDNFNCKLVLTNIPTANESWKDVRKCSNGARWGKGRQAAEQAS